MLTSEWHDLIDLSFLSDDERDAVLQVLDRDDAVRRQDQARIRCEEDQIVLCVV
jgi:hypothetical protein